METIKLVIVDDHKIIRDGLKAILKDDPAISVVGDVSSGDELMVLLQQQQVDILLLDMNMPLKDGVEVTREVKAIYPDIRILINTMSGSPDEIEKALAAGVNGYLMKVSGYDELIKAVKMVADGYSYYGAAVVNTYIKNVGATPNTSKGLTTTELKIVSLLYAEKNHQEIVDEMSITKATLTAHFQNMYRKLNTRTEMGLVKYALREKLI